LIAKKILPKELTAEYEVSFKSLVQQIQERELTDTEQKRREEIAKNMSDENFKKKYGDRWKEVKMAVATNMAKKEIE
jgi:ribosome-associated toxin RatA of RatAB toxin-antitoxin module